MGEHHIQTSQFLAQLTATALYVWRPFTDACRLRLASSANGGWVLSGSSGRIKLLGNLPNAPQKVAAVALNPPAGTDEGREQMDPQPNVLLTSTSTTVVN